MTLSFLEADHWFLGTASGGGGNTVPPPRTDAKEHRWAELVQIPALLTQCLPL